MLNWYLFISELVDFVQVILSYQNHLHVSNFYKEVAVCILSKTASVAQSVMVLASMRKVILRYQGFFCIHDANLHLLTYFLLLIL